MTERNYQGGQKQRIALARALLKDADILLLDEATSDLDSRIQKRVQRSIQSIDEEYTILSISHQLSTVESADRIHIINDGRIAETRIHETLMSADGEYAGLYSMQTNGNY
jgi:subfamily B ATP-binding cassette protein MsbA